MTFKYIDILSNLNKFKTCSKCERINWFKNKLCVDCGCNKFSNLEDSVLDSINKEFDYYVETKGYTDKEVENIIIKV